MINTTLSKNVGQYPNSSFQVHSDKYVPSIKSNPPSADTAATTSSTNEITCGLFSGNHNKLKGVSTMYGDSKKLGTSTVQ